MNPYDTAAILLTLAAAFGYLNYRFLKLPSAIGIMLLSLLATLALIVYGFFSPATVAWAERFVENVEFDETLLNVMLSYLLFAGALHVNLGDLAQQRAVIVILATVGVCVSTFLVGTATYFMLGWFGVEGISYIYCLLFLLIGLEVLALEFEVSHLLLGLLAIPMVLLMRMISASIPVVILRRRRQFSPRVIRILTWGGLRGGISVALVLSLEPGPARDVFLTMTYLVVIFSISVQGLTLKHLIRPVADGSLAK